MNENKNIRVLVADDEEDFRYLMTFWLQSKGYTVLTATNGKEAVALIKKESPDIVFMDLNMPVMDGVQAIKKIREVDAELPIIVISAYLEDARIKNINSCDISGVFYKGKDFAQGLSLLETVLRTHKKLKNK